MALVWGWISVITVLWWPLFSHISVSLKGVRNESPPLLFLQDQMEAPLKSTKDLKTPGPQDT